MGWPAIRGADKEPTYDETHPNDRGRVLEAGPAEAFTPSKSRDHEVGGLLLVVGVRKATWASITSPMGRARTASRHAKVRMKLGDAMTMPLPDARTAARAVKLEVAQGRNPHAEKMDARARAIAERAVKPTTLAGGPRAYEQDMLKRREPSETSRRQAIHYARKAIR